MTAHPTPEARYVVDFTSTLDGGRAAVITDTVTQAGEYLYSDMDPFTFSMVDQQANTIATLSAELAAASAEAERLNLRLLSAERGEADAARAEALFRDAEALLTTSEKRLIAERDSLRAEVERLRTGIIETARMVEDLKRPVHMDCPESPQAARNAHYMSVAYFARALAAPPVAEGV